MNDKLIPWLERTFGANWRTSLSGLITTLCGVALAIILLPEETWQDPKVAAAAILGILAKTAKDFLTKDSRVTGGAVLQEKVGPFRHAGEPEDTLP